MVKQTQTICQLLPTNYLSVFDDFVGLGPKGLIHFRLITLVFSGAYRKGKTVWNLLQLLEMI